MLDRITDYRSCLNQPERWAVATVVEVSGSSPVPVGTSMAVSAELEVIGSLSGGCLESTTAALAQRSIADGAPRVERFGPDGGLLGEVSLTCGGEIRVLIQPLANLRELDDATRLAHRDPHHPAQLTRSISLGAGPSVVVEHRAAAPRLLLFGIQDYSLHCAELALSAGWQVQLIDHRPAFASAHRIPEGAHLRVDHPSDTAAELLTHPASWTAACVMTHLPELDVPVLDTLLRADPGPDFVGALGSRQAQARRRAELCARGHAPASLNRIRGPLGLDIAAASPVESAVSIFAELIMAKNNAEHTHTAVPLSRATGPVNRTRAREASIMRPAAAPGTARAAAGVTVGLTVSR